MTPEQVQFCDAVAQGNAQRAKELLPHVDLDLVPQIDVFKTNNFTYYPAIFCLWAACQTDPQIAISKLRLFFPQESSFAHQSELANIENIKNIVRTLIFPRVKSSLVHLLQNNLALLPGSAPPLVDPLEVEKQQFFIASTTDALGLILSDEYFDDLDPNKSQITQKMYLKLKAFSEAPRQPTLIQNHFEKDREITNQEQPDAIKRLMVALNNASRRQDAMEYEDVNFFASLHHSPPTYLPSTSPLSTKLDRQRLQTSHQINQLHCDREREREREDKRPSHQSKRLKSPV